MYNTSVKASVTKKFGLELIINDGIVETAVIRNQCCQSICSYIPADGTYTYRDHHNDYQETVEYNTYCDVPRHHWSIIKGYFAAYGYKFISHKHK